MAETCTKTGPVTVLVDTDAMINLDAAASALMPPTVIVSPAQCEAVPSAAEAAAASSRGRAS